MKKLLCVEASAGSGKTFRLANRYIALLNIDNPINILAITFTNKAANEMSERIIKFLNELGSDENVVNLICNELNITKDELLKKKNLLIKKFLINEINLSTIDSFINKILRKFSYFAGIRSDFEIDEIDKELVFREFLKSLDENDFKRLIDFAKVEEKFKSLNNLFEELYEKDKELNNLKLDDSLIKIDDSDAKKAFNKLKEYILNSAESSKSAIKAINLDFYEIPYTTWFIKDSLKEYNYFKKKTLYKEWFEDVLVELKTFFKSYFEYKEKLFFKNLFYFYSKYKEIKLNIKKEKNKYSFKDIEHLVYFLLKELNLDKDFLYFRLDSKINHILIDEFQDTSITQWEIFEPLIDEIASGVGRIKNRSFFYVGDVKQAIYRFRGGKKELFSAVANRFKPVGLEVERLNKNYRSAKNIVNFVNEKFDLDEIAFKNESGYVEVDEIDEEKNKAFEAVLKKIEFLNKNGVKDSDIAILVYKNDDILTLAEFLQNKGKSVVTAKKAKVTSQQSVKAIISLMKYLDNKNLKIQKLNFLSLINKKYDEVEIDIKIDRPIKMIKEILDRFDLVDEASLKLLFYSQKFNTLKDFVNEIDNFSQELPYKEFDGITLITIHKSKGLEFDNVIVLDRLSKEDSNKSNILFFYKEAKLKELKLKIKNREFIDNNYKDIIKSEEKLNFEDKKNIEYVAFTRAKNSLIILKKEKNSAFVTKLEKESFGKILPSTIKEKKEYKKIKIDLKNYGVQEIEINEEVEFSPNDFRAIYFGNAIHFAFECEDIEAVRNRFGDFCKIEEVKQQYNLAKTKLNQFLDSIKINNFYNELPFIYEKKLGRIDLLIEGEENFIIDFKSAYPNDGQKYINQINFYKKVVNNLTGKKTNGYLFFIDKIKFDKI